jgi:hypothetical protein
MVKLSGARAMMRTVFLETSLAEKPVGSIEIAILIWPNISAVPHMFASCGSVGLCVETL